VLTLEVGDEREASAGMNAWRVQSPHFTFGSSQMPGTNLLRQAGA
jgi:hypothetical protein